MLGGQCKQVPRYIKYSVMKLFSSIPTYVITLPEHHRRADEQTDRQTTLWHNRALRGIAWKKNVRRYLHAGGTAALVLRMQRREAPTGWQIRCRVRPRLTVWAANCIRRRCSFGSSRIARFRLGGVGRVNVTRYDAPCRHLSSGL